MDMYDIRNSVANMIRGSDRLMASDEIELTAKGKYVAENEAWAGRPAQVLMMLSNRSATIREIAEETRLPVVTAKEIVEQLIKKRYAQKVSYDARPQQQ
mgnify:CR=1 FL=1|jgi:hypothetical protein